MFFFLFFQEKKSEAEVKRQERRNKSFIPPVEKPYKAKQSGEVRI